MIKYLLRRPYVHDDLGLEYVECTGLSSDTKPNEVSLNSLFLELDTKTLYYCSQSGGEEEKAEFEGEVENGLTPKVLDASSFGDTIIVTLDGKQYTCKKREYEDDEGNPVYEWGASRVETEEEYDYDFSVVPFVITYSGRTFLSLADENTHSMTISSLVSTEAEWTKYGEKGSGSSGDMINVYFSDGNIIDDLTTQMARDESIVLPQINGRDVNWDLAYYTDGNYTSGDTFTIPNDSAIKTEVPSGAPFTAPYILFSTALN